MWVFPPLPPKKGPHAIVYQTIWLGMADMWSYSRGLIHFPLHPNQALAVVSP